MSPSGRAASSPLVLYTVTYFAGISYHVNGMLYVLKYINFVNWLCVEMEAFFEKFLDGTFFKCQYSVTTEIFHYGNSICRIGTTFCRCEFPRAL